MTSNRSAMWVYGIAVFAGAAAHSLFWPAAEGGETEAIKKSSLQSAVSQLEEASRLSSRGEYAAAIEICQRSIALLVKELGPHHDNVLAAQLVLAQACIESGDLRTAHSTLNLAALGGRKESALRATILYRLGQVCLMRAASAEARGHLREASRIKLLVRGQRDREAVAILVALAQADNALSQVRDARQHLSEARAIQLQDVNRDPAEEIQILQLLASAHLACDEVSAASNVFAECVALCDAANGTHNEASAKALILLSGTLLREGKMKESLASMERSVSIYIVLNGKDSLEVARGLRALAALSANLGQFDRATEFLKQLSPPRKEADLLEVEAKLLHTSILVAQGQYDSARTNVNEVRKRIGELSSRDHARWFCDVAAYLELAAGNYDQAESYIEESISGASRLEPSPVRDISTRVAAAKIYTASGDFRKASEHIEIALRDLSAAPNSFRYEAANAWLTQGGLLRQMGEREAATTALERAKDLYAELDLHDHHLLATCLVELGRLFRDSERSEAALSLFEEARRIREVLFGEQHCDTAEADDEIGETLRQCGEANRARAYFVKAKAVRIAVLGSEHPACVWSNLHLARLADDSGESEYALRLIDEAMLVARSKLNRHPIREVLDRERQRVAARCK